MTTEYEYLITVPELVGKHADKWIAVIGTQIVAVGESAKEVLATAREKFPDDEPFIAKFPKERAMLL